MKRFVLLIVVLLACAAIVSALEPYDSGLSVSIMRANVRAFGQLRQAMSNEDMLAVTGALAVLADGSLQLLAYEAPKGDQDEWQRIHTGLASAALKGIIAASNEDMTGLSEAVAAIGGFNQEGHRQFQ